jgi:DNA mismatch repair protein MutS
VLLDYVQETQKATVPHLRGIALEIADSYVGLDAVSRRNLELEATLSGDRSATLIGIMDRSRTAMGRRRLRRWITNPIRDRQVLETRHLAVETLITDQLWEPLRDALSGIGDIERIVSRIAMGTARPRDLTALRFGLSREPAIKARIGEATDAAGDGLRTVLGQLPDQSQVHDLLRRAIVDEPPMVLRDGGVIADGWDEELDQYRALSGDANSFLLAYEEEQKRETGIGNLKVGYNRVHGYYIEVSHANQGKVPMNYTRRQTLKAAERYITEAALA